MLDTGVLHDLLAFGSQPEHAVRPTMSYIVDLK